MRVSRERQRYLNRRRRQIEREIESRVAALTGATGEVQEVSRDIYATVNAGLLPALAKQTETLTALAVTLYNAGSVA